MALTEENAIIAQFNLLKANAPAMNATTARQRVGLLKKLLKVVLANRTEITEALYADYNRNPIETDLADTWVVVKEIKFAIRHLEDWIQPKSVPSSLVFFGSSSSVHYEAKGVVLIMAPWNFPFNLTLSPLVSAIAAGNTVLIKPSEYTANSSHLLKKIIVEVFEPEQVAVCEGGVEAARTLLALPFNHIFFTGSEAIGKLVMKAAAEHLASVTLELGGKSPVIIDETVNLKTVARLVAFARFCNTGQVCIAADYVFVKKEIEADFIAELTKAVQRFYPEKELIHNGDYGRLAHLRQAEGTNRILQDALQKGAVAHALVHVSTEERFISPIILSNISSEMLIDQREIFGPILPIKTFSRFSEVAANINAQGKPLAMYVFSKNSKQINYLLQNVSSGATVVNEVFIHHFNSHLPFGGVNKSGMGKSHGHFGFLEFSNQKAVVKQWLPWHVSMLLHPPYTRFSKIVANALLKFFS